MTIPRNEYPRPQFVRKKWLNLNGQWDFSFDSDSFDRTITVPYAYQCKLSGIDIQDFHDHVWYKKTFELPTEMRGKEIILHFGAVDYYCKLWVNGQYLMEHTGGSVGFEADITQHILEGENEIKLWVEDKSSDLEMPRGKQFWEKTSSGIFYTRTTGIWQTVWLEAVEPTHLERVWITPDLDSMSVEFRYELAGKVGAELTTRIIFEGKPAGELTVKTIREGGSFSMGIDQQSLQSWHPFEDFAWSPEQPRLFDVEFTVKSGGETTDIVESYFGLRKISVDGNNLLLNNRPYYQKLLLDQGYWESSLMTAPDDEAFVKDIEMAKAMGFNGVRKHAKVEDPRFLYHADRLGFLVWGEIGAAYAYSRKYVKRITHEWIEEIFRDYNHPSIVAWTPLNESWGVTGILNDKEMQAHSAAMVYLTKSLDTTRPVISNDGWEHTCTDLLTIHDYEYRREILEERYKDIETILSAFPSHRKVMANGWEYKGQPVLVTEFGGISYQKGSQTGWGYSTACSDEDFAKRYNDVIAPILKSKAIKGFCYTQLTDVEQEINGLLTYDRQYKIDPEIIKAINEGRYE